MKKFKAIYGQELFLVLTLTILYMMICFITIFKITGYVPSSEEISIYIFELLIFMFIFSSIFSITNLIIIRLSKKVYAECYPDYMIINKRTVFYKDIMEVVYQPLKYLGGYRGSSLGPTLEIYNNIGDYEMLDKVSIFFFLYLKKKCINSKLRILS